MNLEAILTQLDQTRDDLLIAWGRLCVIADLPQEVAAEIEGYARELDILTKLHLHAISDGRVPASLLSILTETQKARKARFNAFSDNTPAETLLDETNANSPPASLRETTFSDPTDPSDQTNPTDLS